MKKNTLFFISLLSFGISLFLFPNIVSAKEISLEEVETEIIHIGNLIVEETIVPNEIADEWAQINGWEEDYGEDYEKHELTENSPHIIVPFGASPPLLQYWNVSTKGRYSFSGTFNYNRALYTNYYIRGATKYYTKVQNHKSYRIGIQAKDRLSTYYSTSIPGNSTLYTTITINSSSNNFYLKFFPVDLQNGSISGYIEMR